MNQLPWYEELLRALDTWLQPAVAFLILFWLLWRLVLKKKRGPARPGQDETSSAGGAGEPPPASGALATIKATLQSWDDSREPQAPAAAPAPAPRRGESPDIPPYREQGVRAGWLLGVLVVIGVLALVYYLFPDQLRQLWRQLTGGPGL